jgi:aspartate carbamoyltransferase regulatory subunit
MKNTQHPNLTPPHLVDIYEAVIKIYLRHKFPEDPVSQIVQKTENFIKFKCIYCDSTASQLWAQIVIKGNFVGNFKCHYCHTFIPSTDFINSILTKNNL